MIMSQYGFFCRHLKMGRPSCFSPSSNDSHKPAVIFVIMIITSIQQWHDYLVFTPCSMTALPTMQANVNVQRAPCQTLAHFSKCAFLRQNDKEACRCLAQFKKKDAYFFAHSAENRQNAKCHYGQHTNTMLIDSPLYYSLNIYLS